MKNLTVPYRVSSDNRGAYIERLENCTYNHITGEFTGGTFKKVYMFPVREIPTRLSKKKNNIVLEKLVKYYKDQQSHAITGGTWEPFMEIDISYKV